MECKVFELRDHATFIPLLAVKLGSRIEAERYLLARAGFGRDYGEQNTYILLMSLNGGKGSYDCEFFDRTYAAAHQHILEHWDELASGCVVDVRVILGEESEVCQSEAIEAFI